MKVVHRSDYDYNEVADSIKDSVLGFSKMGHAEVRKCREHASLLSTKAYWSRFITYYEEAYDVALRKTVERR